MQAKTMRALLAGLLVPGFVVAVHAAEPALSAAPTDAEAEAAHEAAKKAFQNTRANAAQNQPAPVLPTREQQEKADAAAANMVGVPSVMVFSDPTREVVPGTADVKNVALHSIRVVIDVENETLREVLHKVISQAARYTGPWQVKWRLKPENLPLLDERVNLTAEATFGDFLDLLTERVKNMSGTQLFITTFNQSRIIMVADTYY